MKFYIPWKVIVAAYLIYQRFISVLSRFTIRKKYGADISFYCNYQQTTGSTVAITCIANQLAGMHNVDAYIKPLSGFTKLLALNVRQYFSPKALSGNLVFVDIEQDNDIIENLIADNKQVILSCHALPTELHGVPQVKLIKNLELSTHIHFVSRFQRLEFIHHYPHINIDSKSFVILNYTRQSKKQGATHNIGIVGYLNRDAKNAIKGVQLAQQSNAQLIQCWGSEDIAGLDDPGQYPKLRINGWSESPIVMHQSFDVLISTSKFETFGLVTAEALSAGIPCVLSDIPVYRELYSACNGVVILSGDDQQDIQSINQLLENAQNLKSEIIEFWKTHFSNETVKQAWFAKIAELYNR
jgi:glycosyltransferase involved in cell wall biosynthesis